MRWVMTDKKLSPSQKRTLELKEKGLEQTNIYIKIATHERLKQFTQTAGFNNKSEAINAILDNALSNVEAIPDDLSTYSLRVQQWFTRFIISGDEEALMNLMTSDEKHDADELMSRYMANKMGMTVQDFRKEMVLITIYEEDIKNRVAKVFNDEMV